MGSIGRMIRALGLAALVSGPAMAAQAAEVAGTVMSGDAAVPYPTVTLYRAGGAGGSATSLGQTQAGEDGAFSIHYTAPGASDAVLYLVADNAFTSAAGRAPGAVRLATVLGTAPVTNQVVINERSTVATAVAMAQFIEGTTIAGPSPGLQNAALTLRNIVDVGSGEVASLLGTPPNGLLTSTMKTFNTMANMLAACVESSKASACNKLFKAAKAPGGSPPADTLTAAINIAHYPWQHVKQLFKLSQQASTYQPVLDAAPDAWTLALIYVGNGHELNGAGYVTFDEEGNAWVANNYVYSKEVGPDAVVCGGEQVIKLTPDGHDAPGAPFEGGGRLWGRVRRRDRQERQCLDRQFRVSGLELHEGHPRQQRLGIQARRDAALAGRHGLDLWRHQRAAGHGLRQ